MWDVRSNKLIFKIQTHPEPITSIDISSDSTLISSSSYDCYVRLWDVFKGQCIKTMMPDDGSIHPISFSRFTPKTSQHMLFGIMNSTIGLYDYESRLLKTYKGHLNEALQIDAKFVKN
jgi:WD40 repeat protein